MNKIIKFFHLVELPKNIGSIRVLKSLYSLMSTHSNSYFDYKVKENLRELSHEEHYWHVPKDVEKKRLRMAKRLALKSARKIRIELGN